MPEISFNPSPVFYIIIGALAGMVIGWIMGFFDSNNRSSKKIHSAELKSEAAINEAKEKIAQAERKISAASHSSKQMQDDPGLLRLKNDNGRFTLEVDGAPVTASMPADKRKRLIELVTAFRPYLEGGQTSQASSHSAAPNLTPPGPASPQRAVPVQVGVSVPLQTPAKKPEPEKNVSELSIVGQIDTVLQKRLMDTPLAKSGIRLQESLRGGVEVYVGIQKYDSIDDVPDENIKSLIRAAIAEWEQKFTPGI
ncbi:MAG: hypothetical protein HY863_22015 [Chloroflexi bacterium]|nr:hypothetical protein [Chloroflexota bacterium]